MKECPTTKVSGQGTGGLVLETFLHCERSFIFFNGSCSDIMRLNGFLLRVKDPQYVTPRAVTSAEINVFSSAAVVNVTHGSRGLLTFFFRGL